MFMFRQQEARVSKEIQVLTLEGLLTEEAKTKLQELEAQKKYFSEQAVIYNEAMQKYYPQ